MFKYLLHTARYLFIEHYSLDLAIGGSVIYIWPQSIMDVGAFIY